MTEPTVPYRAGSAPGAPLDSVAAALARFNAEDPHLVELLDRARRAFDELAAYMAAKCAAAGVEVPEEWKRRSRTGGAPVENQDERQAKQ